MRKTIEQMNGKADQRGEFLSVTTSKVSDRASARAGDQMAGACTAAPTAMPDTDLRKSQPFIGYSKTKGTHSASDVARFVPRLGGR